MARAGGRVTDVEPGLAADAAGVRAGDRLLAADGHVLRDVLDVAWYEADGIRTLEVQRGGREILLRVPTPGPLGLRFGASTFDGVRRCRNKCAFCFVDQLPGGLRRPLYVKDDDYRLSMLYGNFVTLTNLTDESVARIVEQRISPLYVSWHSSDRAVRSLLLGIRRDRGPHRLQQLLDAGIGMHLQIVLCPGLNDGSVLVETLGDLYSRGEGIASVGVVPVGRSSTGAAAGMPRPPTRAEVLSTLAIVEETQRLARRERSSAWVWPADELVLQAGLRIPGTRYYEDFPQLGNGVGLSRAFLSGLGHRLRGRREQGGPPLVLITGECARPVMEEAARTLADRRGLRASVTAVSNRLFAGQVTVTGLLGGAEVRDAIGSVHEDALVLVPDVIFEPGGRTLDGLTAREVLSGAPKRAFVVPSDGEGFGRFVDARGWDLVGTSSASGKKRGAA